MSISEYWACVEHHEGECSVCSIVDNGRGERPVSRFKALWQVVSDSAWFWWACVFIVLIGAYVLALKTMYDIVAGLN